EPATEIGRRRKAVDSGRVADHADDGVLVDVDDDDLGAVADVEPAGGRIHGGVIPRRRAADGNFLEQTIRVFRAANRCRGDQESTEANGPEFIFHMSEELVPNLPQLNL